MIIVGSVRRRLGWLAPRSRHLMRRPLMAAARDQAARIVRVEPETADEPARDAAAALVEQLRHVADDTMSRRPAETLEKTISEKTTPEKPAAAPAVVASPAAASPAAPKAGKRKL